MNRIFALGVVAAAALTVSGVAQAADNGGKWFVLRQETGGTCWPAKLISVNGQYASGSALKAGGPFDAEADAQSRIAELQAIGACRAE